MPGKTNTDKIDGLRDVCAELSKTDAIQQKELDSLHEQIKKFDKQLDSLRIELPLLQQSIAELKKSGELRGGRIWDVFKLLLAAAVGSAATYFLKP